MITQRLHAIIATSVITFCAYCFMPHYVVRWSALRPLSCEGRNRRPDASMHALWNRYARRARLANSGRKCDQIHYERAPIVIYDRPTDR